MALVEHIGEMKQKEVVKQFNFFQIELVEDIGSLLKNIGAELFIEVVNTGLETVARKRARFNSDPKLSNPQLVQVRRIKDLIAMEAISYEKGFELLVANGIDGELVKANLEEVEG